MNADPILAVGRTTNADLMVDCDRLGYLVDPVLDATYGLGAFWRALARARAAVAVDLDPRRGVLVADFRSLPFADDEFATVVFDPPYKLNGTGGSHPSDDRYGVGAAGVSWQDKHELIRDGITECARVLRPGGHLLVKCQDQVCSGSVRWQTREFADHGEQIGLRLVDSLHVVGHRRQPPGRRQVHACGAHLPDADDLSLFLTHAVEVDALVPIGRGRSAAVGVIVVGGWGCCPGHVHFAGLTA